MIAVISLERLFLAIWEEAPFFSFSRISTEFRDCGFATSKVVCVPIGDEIAFPEKIYYEVAFLTITSKSVCRNKWLNSFAFM